MTSTPASVIIQLCVVWLWPLPSCNRHAAVAGRSGGLYGLPPSAPLGSLGHCRNASQASGRQFGLSLSPGQCICSAHRMPARFANIPAGDGRCSGANNREFAPDWAIQSHRLNQLRAQNSSPDRLGRSSKMTEQSILPSHMSGIDTVGDGTSVSASYHPCQPCRTNSNKAAAPNSHPRYVATGDGSFRPARIRRTTIPSVVSSANRSET